MWQKESAGLCLVCAGDLAEVESEHGDESQLLAFVVGYFHFYVVGAAAVAFLYSVGEYLVALCVAHECGGHAVGGCVLAGAVAYDCCGEVGFS